MQVSSALLEVWEGKVEGALHLPDASLDILQEEEAVQVQLATAPHW